MYPASHNTGDFNGEGRDDLAALYGYADGSVTLFTFLTASAGSFSNPIQGWTSTNWGSWDRIHLYSGHFTGDGRDDVAVWYDYADGRDGIHTFVWGRRHRSRGPTATRTGERASRLDRQPPYPHRSCGGAACVSMSLCLAGQPSAITGALEARGSLRDVQAMAGHANSRTTERYDRMRGRLDKAPVYALGAVLAE